jgi:hypothetical protein
MNRRQFLAAAPAAASGWQQPSRIQVVDIVHHTHTDIGYTEMPSVVRDLQRRYLDAAIDACHADPAFRWTVEALINLDDWWRGASPVRRKAFLALVARGQMDVMGMPFNQTPFLNAQQWRKMMHWIPEDLRRQLDIRAAMQNDVNGIPRAGAMALLDRGVSRLLMGLNADSGGPPFARPSAFWWKMPDNRRLFVWHGEHYGSVMAYLSGAWKRDRLLADDASVKAAHAGLLKRVQALEASGYALDRLILTYTDPLHYDNGAPVPSLASLVVAWNKLGLKPALRLVTATEAVIAMEKAAGATIPTHQGEWTDWWANGDASGPREVAASRAAKRYFAAASSPLLGPMPARAEDDIDEILRDLCLFDEHTWGASQSISQPYSLWTQGQYTEKSLLAYRPMGKAEILLKRRLRAYLDPQPAGEYVVNPTAGPMSGWGSTRTEDGKPLRFWVEPIAPHSARRRGKDAAPATTKPNVTTDSAGWPQAATWPGMKQPLFSGDLGHFVQVGFVPPANRSTIAQLHANHDLARRNAIVREAAAAYAAARLEETPYTLRYTQEIDHERLARAQRIAELWKDEARARVTLRFDRISSTDPEVLFIAFALPDGAPLPIVASGGVPFTPYRDQLPGACRDYLGIDGWADYACSDGHRLWVTRDAPLVAIGAPHVVERHQSEPAQPNRILAMVFDNCWHTNFVANQNGTLEFQFDLAWKPELPKPADVAEALASDPIVLTNYADHEPPALLENLYRP